MWKCPYIGCYRCQNTDPPVSKKPTGCWPLDIPQFNSLRPRQNGRHFADDIFKRIFLNENVRITIKISLKFVPKVRINNIPALVQIMAWRRPGDKPLSGPMMVSLLTHICVTRPQWVKCMLRYMINTSRRHFRMHFLEWKSLNLEYSLTEVCSQGSNRQWYSIGSDNGLAPIRRQAIIWTNDGLCWWRL